MYIYNVTVNIDTSIQANWLSWMRNKHIPEMLALGQFSKAKLCKVLINEEMGGVTYSVEYTVDSLNTLKNYYENNAEEMRKHGMELFQNKFVAFRTELEVIDEQFSINSKKVRQGAISRTAMR